MDLEEMLFRIRIDTTVAREVAIKEWVSGFHHVLVKHELPNGRNPHVHIFLDAPYKSAQSCRYNVRKVTNAKGPEMSVTECDPARQDEYIQYLFNRKHGNQWTLVSSTLDTAEHQRKALEVKEEFDSQQEASKKKTGPTQWELAVETSAEAISRIDEDRVSMAYVEQTYVEACIDVHRKHKKTFCDFSLLRVVQTALSGTKHGRAKLVGSILDRLNK